MLILVPHFTSLAPDGSITSATDWRTRCGVWIGGDGSPTDLVLPSASASASQDACAPATKDASTHPATTHARFDTNWISLP